MEVPWGAIITGSITLIIAMVGHLVATVWWMSKIQTSLQILTTTVDAIGRTMAKHESMFYSKEDVIREISRIQAQLDAMWKRIDSFNTKEEK